MPDTLSQLWQIQQLDNEITFLTQKEKDIPKKIEGLKLTHQEMIKKSELEKKELLNLKKRYKEQELDLKSCEEKISQYSVQLYSAKNNEQYKAFLKEIELQKRLKTEIEEAMLFSLEMIEEKEKLTQRQEKELKALEEVTNAKIASLKKEEADIKKIRQEKEKEREQFIQGVDKEAVAIYEKIRSKKDGVAVSEVVKERCSVCFNPVPPQRILEIKRRLNLYFCDYCGRILYISE